MAVPMFDNDGKFIGYNFNDSPLVDKVKSVSSKFNNTIEDIVKNFNLNTYLKPEFNIYNILENGRLFKGVQDVATNNIKGKGYINVANNELFDIEDYSRDDGGLEFNNYILIEYAGGSQGVFQHNIPCYPDEISEQTTAQWTPQSIIGRSAPVAAFTGTGFRSVTINLTLHRELTKNPEDIENLLADARRAVYPAFLSEGYVPPVTTVKIGELKVKGLCNSVNYQWKKPVIDERYQLCELSLAIDSILPAGYNGAGANSSYFKSSMNPFNF